MVVSGWLVASRTSARRQFLGRPARLASTVVKAREAARGKEDSFDDDDEVSSAMVANFVEPNRDANNTLEEALLLLSEMYSR